MTEFNSVKGMATIIIAGGPIVGCLLTINDTSYAFQTWTKFLGTGLFIVGINLKTHHKNEMS